MPRRDGIEDTLVPLSLASPYPGRIQGPHAAPARGNQRAELPEMCCQCPGGRGWHECGEKGWGKKGWLGLVWHGLAWHGLALHSLARLGMTLTSPCLHLAWLDLVWSGLARYSLAWLGTAQPLSLPGLAWPGTTRLGMEWLGLVLAWQSLAGLGTAWLGMARHCTAIACT